MKWLVLLLLIGTALSNSPEENENSQDPNLFEGDMILSPEQRHHAENGEDVDSDRKRGSIRNNLWPGGVLVYQIDSSLSRIPAAMGAVRAGMREWSSKTCIRFRPRRANEAAFVLFRRGPRNVCSSAVGRRGARQDINLDQGCWTQGIVTHEIAHALGFFHEQSRPDRDNFVRILRENIRAGTEHNFRKYPRSLVDSLGTPYDYASVMHYGGTAFSKNGRPTIVSRRPGVTLGQRRGLSRIDAQQANLLYRCRGVVTPRPTPAKTTRPTPGSCRDRSRFCPFYRRLCRWSRRVRYYCPRTCRRC